MNDTLLKNLGRGVAQINRRLARVLAAVENGGGAAPGRGEDLLAEFLFDLLDAVDAALDDARRARSRAGSPGAALPKASWPARAARCLGQRVSRGRPSETRPPLPPGLRGLALARDQAVDRLARNGVEPIACTGAFDPALHHVIDTEPTPNRELHETLVHTYRRGWTRGRGADKRVLRHAQVRLHRYQEARLAPSQTFGIDLGTTCSAIGLVREGRPSLLEIEGEILMPSVVSYRRGQPPLVAAPGDRTQADPFW